MLDSWVPLIALIATLLLLLVAQRWITRLLQQVSYRWIGDPDVTLIVYFVLVLPGVLIHELSHWLAAVTLGVRVRKVSIGPVRQARGRRVSLGSIQVANADPLRNSLIGVAPLLGGSAIIVLVGNLVLDVGQLSSALSGQGVHGILAWLSQIVQVADFWLWLYLIFSVSNAMLPSRSDMNAVRPVLLFLGMAALIVIVVVGIPSIPADVVQGVNAVAGYLASAFGLTLATDVVFLIFIGLLSWITVLVQRR
jgi:hypothetical protein